MAGRTRSRSRTRRPPLQPLSGIAPPPRPRPPLQLPTRTKAKSVGPVVPDINRQGPPHLFVHRTGVTAPKPPPELPPRYMRPTPKILVNYAKRAQDIPTPSQVTPKRPNITNAFFAARRSLNTRPPMIRPTSAAVFAKAEARAQHHDWADFSPYVPQAERLPDHVSAFDANGHAKWFHRYPQREPTTDSVELREIMYYLAFPQTAGEQTAQSQSNINDRFLPLPINRNQEGIGFRHAALHRHSRDPDAMINRTPPYHHLEAYPSTSLILFFLECRQLGTICSWRCYESTLFDALTSHCTFSRS